MSKEKRRVPKLRFPGFTEDWEQRKFKDIAFKRGKISEADLPYVEFEDINSGIGTLNKNISQKVGHKKGLLFEAGDVLFGKLRPYLQNWLLCQFAGIAVGDFWVLQPQNVSSAFLYYLIQSEAYQSVANISSGTKMPRSSWPLVSETLFSIPKYKEANMIGEFFLLIDRTITLHQRKLNNLKLKKKALLQKLFPKNEERYPELRFPGFTDAWEQRKLIYIFNDFIVPMRDKPKVFSGTTPWTRIEDIEGRYINTSLSGQFVSDETIKSMNLKVIPKGSLIVSASATFGVVAIVNNDLITNQTFIGLVPNKDFDIDFLYSLFEAPTTKGKLLKLSAGSTIFYIARESFENLVLSVPSKEEQIKISKVFKSIDDSITLHQRKLDHLQLQKKALLQQMFV